MAVWSASAHSPPVPQPPQIPAHSAQGRLDQGSASRGGGAPSAVSVRVPGPRFEQRSAEPADSSADARSAKARARAGAGARGAGAGEDALGADAGPRAAARGEAGGATAGVAKRPGAGPAMVAGAHAERNAAARTAPRRPREQGEAPAGRGAAGARPSRTPASPDLALRRRGPEDGGGAGGAGAGAYAKELAALLAGRAPAVGALRADAPRGRDLSWLGRAWEGVEGGGAADVQPMAPRDDQAAMGNGSSGEGSAGGGAGDARDGGAPGTSDLLVPRCAPAKRLAGADAGPAALAHAAEVRRFLCLRARGGEAGLGGGAARGGADGDAAAAGANGSKGAAGARGAGASPRASEEQGAGGAERLLARCADVVGAAAGAWERLAAHGRFLPPELLGALAPDLHPLRLRRGGGAGHVAELLALALDTREESNEEVMSLAWWQRSPVLPRWAAPRAASALAPARSVLVLHVLLALLPAEDGAGGVAAREEEARLWRKSMRVLRCWWEEHRAVRGGGGAPPAELPAEHGPEAPAAPAVAFAAATMGWTMHGSARESTRPRGAYRRERRELVRPAQGGRVLLERGSDPPCLLRRGGASAGALPPIGCAPRSFMRLAPAPLAERRRGARDRRSSGGGGAAAVAAGGRGGAAARGAEFVWWQGRSGPAATAVASVADAVGY